MAFKGITDDFEKSRVLTDSLINGNVSFVVEFGLDQTGLK